MASSWVVVNAGTEVKRRTIPRLGSARSHGGSWVISPMKMGPPRIVQTPHIVAVAPLATAPATIANAHQSRPAKK